MFSSLRSRLWLSYAFLIVTALNIVAIVLFIYLLTNPFLYRQITERLKVVETLALTGDGQPQGQSFPVTMEKTARTFNVRLVLYSVDGQILADTSAVLEPVIPYPQKKLFARITPIARDAGGKAWLYTLRQLPDRSWLLVAVPRPRLSIVNVFADDLLPLFWEGGLIALLLSLVMAFFFARWIADPMQKIVTAARTMPSADAKPVDVNGPREIQNLAQAFNAMIARVQSSQQSQRDFIANVSHELKTPLTSIQGFAQAILGGTAETPAALKQAAEVIYNESGRMHRMVLDLLDLARLDAGIIDFTLAPLNITSILNAVTEKFLLQAQKVEVTLKIEAPPDLPTLLGDGDRLAQVFTNLVDNALKFTPLGGIILLRAMITNGEILTTVSDSGPGIPIDAIPHIFDRFYQADPARKGGERHGAGLGLAIAREIVQAHGGRISVRSELGKGTTFEVSLPLSHM